MNTSKRSLYTHLICNCFVITAEGGHPVHCRDRCDSVLVCHLLLDEEPQVSPLCIEVLHNGASLLLADH